MCVLPRLGLSVAGCLRWGVSRSYSVASNWLSVLDWPVLRVLGLRVAGITFCANRPSPQDLFLNKVFFFKVSCVFSFSVTAFKCFRVASRLNDFCCETIEKLDRGLWFFLRALCSYTSPSCSLTEKNRN